MLTVLTIETAWKVVKILFRIYQYTCYSFLVVLLLPVIVLYIFDFMLYFCRLVSFCCRWQVYHIRNQSGSSISFISERGGRILRLKNVPSDSEIIDVAVDQESKEQCDSSNASVLSAFDEGSEQSLSDTPYSSNYCLTSSPHDCQIRKNTQSRRSTIAGTGDNFKYAFLTPDNINTLVEADSDFTKLRRTKSSDVSLSLDRYDTQRMRASN